jgi:hypothetical protein
MIVITRFVSGIATLDFARGVAEAIPYRLTLSIFVGGTLDLIRGCGGSPQKRFRNRELSRHRSVLLEFAAFCSITA